MELSVLAITQARIGSSRLPSKVLKDINGKALLQLHLERLIKSRRANKFIVATTHEEGVDQIENIAANAGFDIYKGSLNNVLDRFYQAAKNVGAHYIVRLTSDCPLLDATLIDEIIDCCIKGNYDYVSNTLNPTYPDGLDVEVFTMQALEQAWQEASLDSEKEHVTPYIWKNSSFFSKNTFKSFSFENKVSYEHIRLTVDEQEDLQLIQELTKRLGFERPWLEYVNCLLHNDLLNFNNSFTRNEGFIKSINND